MSYASLTRKAANPCTFAQPTHIPALASCSGERAVNSFTAKQSCGAIKPLAAVEHESFRAVARVRRDADNAKFEPRVTRALMDPGAELNLVRKSLMNALGKGGKLKVHAREPANITLLNNGKAIGNVKEAVYLSFCLDTPEGGKHLHHEWFHVWENMDEEMILGAAFCKEAGLTQFHTLLKPWNDVLYHTSVSSKKPTKRSRDVEQIETAEGVNSEPLPTADKTRGQERATNAQIFQRKLNKSNEPSVSDVEDHELAALLQRDRVTTNPEKISEHYAKHSAQALAPTVKIAGRRRAEPTTFMPLLCVNDHSNHAPVKYNINQSKQIAHMLARQTIDNQKALYKQLKQLAATDVVLTMEEQQTLRDTARMCAQEAAAVFEHQQHLLGTKTSEAASCAKPQRYFMGGDSDELLPSPVESTVQRFATGQCVVLKNLINHHELNGKPARVVNYDEQTMLYAVSLASPKGYWWASDDKLKSIDPLPAKDDFKACGIDPSSGQPTLDPLAKPVHRQYGSEHSKALTARITALLEKYKHVFGKDVSQPCKFRPMMIELIPGANLPRNPRHWKNSPAQRAEVRAQLQSFIDMGVVRASTTAIVSNVLLVKRPGMPGKFRFTIDFRELNDATVAMPWQMPEVQDQLSRLAGNTIFGCLDLSSYYHQIELDSGSKFLTGFVTEDGVFEYQRVPMGLKNACAHAQSQLQMAIDADETLSKFGLRNYFDDLPLAAKTEDEFIEQLEAVLRLGDRFNLKFNLDKSIFGVDSITHVGFVVNADGVQVDPQRVESLREIEVPKSMKAVQSVLGVWNYIRNFIPNFSTRALPLTNLVGSKKKAKAFLWTEECQKAFEDLKAATLDTKLLANVDYTRTIFIRCDSSQFGAGAVLFQFNDQGQEMPIAYASRKYTLAERNYCTFQQEAAAVVWSLEKFSNFHQGHHVVVQSDHKNLSWIKKTAMPQLTRWRLRLQDFDFALEYYEGAKNVVADGLSRKSVDDSDIDISIRDFIPEHAAQQSFLQGAIPTRCLNQYCVSRKTIELTAAEKIWESPSSGGNAEGSEHTSPEAASREGRLWDEHSESDSEYESESEGDECSEEQTPAASFANVAPIAAGAPAAPELPALPHLDDSSPRTVFNQMHNEIVGHSGVLVTLNRVLRADKAWATRAEMISQIDEFISGCVVCQKFRKRHNRQTGERFVIEGNPFSELSVDILKLPKRDCNNNLYVVVIVDSFSRWVSLEAVPDKSALSAARAILKTVGNFGVPLTIRSDGGKEFLNDILASVEHLMGIKHHKVMAYHHEGNSLAEKANRSVLENLRNLIFDKRYILNGEHQWSDLLPLAQRIMNASFNSSIGCSPAALIFGSNIELDRCLVTPSPVAQKGIDVPQYVQNLTHNQRVMMDAAAITLNATHAKNISKWNKNHKRENELKMKLQAMASDDAEHDAVWVLARIQNDAPKAKWAPKWAGPFRLLDFKEGSQSTVRLYDTVEHKVVESHINDLALWNPLFEESVEGLQKIAETDNWHYPIDGIVGIALEPENESDEPIALPLDRARQFVNKHKYLFSVKWHGYPEPSWEPYSSVEHTSSLTLFSSAHPILKLTKL